MWHICVKHNKTNPLSPLLSNLHKYGNSYPSRIFPQWFSDDSDNVDLAATHPRTTNQPADDLGRSLRCGGSALGNRWQHRSRRCECSHRRGGRCHYCRPSQCWPPCRCQTVPDSPRASCWTEPWRTLDIPLAQTWWALSGWWEARLLSNTDYCK